MTTPDALRRRMMALTGLAEAEVRALVLELGDFASRALALEQVMPLLIDSYGQMASAVAAEWYDEFRESLGVPGSFRAAAAPMPANNGALELVGWARSTAKDPDSMIDLVLGGMQRRVSNQARLTIMGAANLDPRSTGWRRIGVGKNCPLCDVLISRGAVYSEKSVRFGTHDHCNCQSAPAFGRWSDASEVDDFKPTERRRDPETTAADQERVRKWIADNLVG
jgi:hypothetical protein